MKWETVQEQSLFNDNIETEKEREHGRTNKIKDKHILNWTTNRQIGREIIKRQDKHNLNWTTNRQTGREITKRQTRKEGTNVMFISCWSLALVGTAALHTTYFIINLHMKAPASIDKVFIVQHYLAHLPYSKRRMATHTVVTAEW